MEIRMAGFKPANVIKKNKAHDASANSTFRLSMVNRSATSTRKTLASLYTHKVAPIPGQRWRTAKRVPIVSEQNILEATD